MKELAIHIARHLVDQPDKVDVTASEDGAVTRLTLKVAEEDKGKIIGKQGKVIKAIRAIVSVAAAKANRTVVLDVE
ncbi:MAG: KH domain-containing protein [Elusimicrobia bacterium]|nr:KH domain-containing protein [Elusimicrobiota bacterium]